MSHTLIYNVKFIELINKGIELCFDKYYKNCNLNCLDNFQNNHNYIRIDRLLKPHNHDKKEQIFIHIKFNHDINVRAYTNLIKSIDVVKLIESLEWHVEFTWYSAINAEYSGYESLYNAILKIQIYDTIPSYKPFFRKRIHKKRSKNTAYQSWTTF